MNQSSYLNTNGAVTDNNSQAPPISSTRTHLIGRSGAAAVLCQLQHGPVALTAGGTVEAVRPVVMYPLMVSEVPSQAEGFPTQVAHVALLTVDPHVVAQGHVVGVRFAAEVTSEFGDESRLEVRVRTNDSDTSRRSTR